MSAPILKLKENDQLGLKVCKKLSDLFEASARSQPGGRSYSSPSKRCILVLLDRFDDLQTMLYHGWTYLSLI